MRTTLLTLCGLLLATTTFAQVATVTINPNNACFIAPDYAATDPGGIVVATFRLEIWAPGADTTTMGPIQNSGDLPKSVAVADPTVVNRYCIPSTAWGFTITKGPTFQATILEKGDGGSARSTFSNPFSFPLPVRAPAPVTGLTMVAAPK